MNDTIDISAVTEQIVALHREATHRRNPGHESIAVVVPLAEGRFEVVREFLAEGPPFDPAAIGLESHKVFLTDHEAVFIFETEDGAKALERILDEPELWDVVSAWKRCSAAEPRIGTAVYEWPRRPEESTDPRQ
jgi:hypothetical protein